MSSDVEEEEEKLDEKPLLTKESESELEGSGNLAHDYTWWPEICSWI